MSSRTKERKAFKELKRKAPGSRLTRYAGLVVRTRKYMEYSQDKKTRRMMTKLFRSLKTHSVYETILEIGENHSVNK